jgi:hypothetical protein
MVRCIPTKTTATAPDTAALLVEHVVRLYGVPLSYLTVIPSSLVISGVACLPC